MRRIALLHNWCFAICATLGVFALNIAINSLTHARWGDAIAIVYFALYGLYCLQNYWGCREIHCAITGPGFLLAALLMALRDTNIFDHGYGVPYNVFLATAVLGYTVEWVYQRRTGRRFHQLQRQGKDAEINPSDTRSA